MWTKRFWKQTADRAVRTAVQCLLASWGAGTAASRMFDGLSIDIRQAAGIGLGAAIISVATSIAASTPWAPGDEGDPSVVK